MPLNRFILTLLLSDREPTLPAIMRGPFSQTELSEKLEIAASSINDWEQGRTFPQPRHVRALIAHAAEWAPLLGVKLLDILDPANLEQKEPEQ